MCNKPGSFTPVRASELVALRRADLHLEVELPLFKVPALITKNGKSVESGLHPELLAALRNHRSKGTLDDALVVFKQSFAH